jgi:hypothetical protein
LSPTCGIGGNSRAAVFLRVLALTPVSFLLPNPKASYMTCRGLRGMKGDDEMVRHEFAPSEEPTIYAAADICAEVGHERCKGIETKIEG